MYPSCTSLPIIVGGPGILATLIPDAGSATLVPGPKLRAIAGPRRVRVSFVGSDPGRALLSPADRTARRSQDARAVTPADADNDEGLEPLDERSLHSSHSVRALTNLVGRVGLEPTTGGLCVQIPTGPR
jgi:hypothetical protein